MIRTTRPTAGNKYFITKSNGGYSTCIKGKPTDSQCNVLSNCVGYANGAFNEELNLGYEKYHLNCNAENFIERAIASGLNVYKTPSVGDIICWEGKGSLAGHVAIVIEVIDSNTIRTAESGYGRSNPFWITTRKNNNGRWGTNSNYPLRGFIENPNYPHNKPVPPTPPTPTPSTKYKVGDKVIIDGQLYGTADGGNPGQIVHNKVTNITRVAEGHLYPYNTTGDLGWMAEACIKPYEEPSPTPTPTPQPTTYNVGDEVIVNGVLTADSYGGGAHTKNYNNQKAKIIIIKNDGRPRPYALNMNNNMNGVTGWGSKDQIRK